MELLNRYSLMVFGLAIIALVMFVSWNFFGKKPAISISFVAIALLILFQLIMSTGPSRYVTVQEFNETVLNGKPTVLMVYSNF